MTKKQLEEKTGGKVKSKKLDDGALQVTLVLDDRQHSLRARTLTEAYPMLAEWASE